MKAHVTVTPSPGGVLVTATDPRGVTATLLLEPADAMTLCDLLAETAEPLMPRVSPMEGQTSSLDHPEAA